MQKSQPWATARKILITYADRVSAFHINARLYLVNAILTGAAMGVFRLLFNFYVLSLGYDQALLGNLVTASSLTALLTALPMGYLADRLGRKTSLLLGSAGVVVAVLMMIQLPSIAMFIGMNVLMGLAQSLAGVTMGPFLMENSGEKERTYLFSITSGLQMASAFAGNWLGGVLPTWVSVSRSISATSADAYAGALLLTVLLGAVGLIPLLLIRLPRLSKENRSAFAPLAMASKNPRLLTQLVLPMLVTSLGAGLIMPFMNVFFRQVYHQPDPVIGAMFAWGSLAMGVGFIIAPPLADRFGKIQLVVFTQAISIPFLALLGFAPWFAVSAAAYYIRLGLMNMSSPVYQTFVMEKVDPDARATIASLISMANSFGWALSPTVSGWLQVNYGFGPAFLGTIGLYLLSTFLYWKYFFPRGEQALRPVT